MDSRANYELGKYVVKTIAQCAQLQLAGDHHVIAPSLHLIPQRSSHVLSMPATCLPAGGALLTMYMWEDLQYMATPTKCRRTTGARLLANTEGTHEATRT